MSTTDKAEAAVGYHREARRRTATVLAYTVTDEREVTE